MGCSSAKLSPNFKSLEVNRIAILPIKPPSDLSREKLEILKQTISEELSANGYTVLDSSLSDRFCNESTCGDNLAFSKKYNIQAYVRIEDLSVERINALVGYFNYISGTLKIADPENAELGAVYTKVSERGGLIFNSGQVIKAITSSAENTANLSFARLSKKFAWELIKNLPSNKQTSEIAEVKIDHIKVSPENSFGRYKVCINGTPNLQASLYIDSLPATLREITPGQYCGIFPLSGNFTPKNNFKIKLESPYGISKEILLKKSEIQTCRISNFEYASDEEIIFNCKNSKTPSECEEVLKACKNTSILAYKKSADGAYQKVGTFNLSNTKFQQDIELLGLNRDGGTSLLTLLKEQK